MEYVVLLFLHLTAGVFWAGGAITAGFFIIPAVLAAGPAGGPVMAGVVARRFPAVMTAAAVVSVLSGLRLYMIRFTPGWLSTGEGLVVTAGGLLGIGAFIVGVFVQRPTAQRLGALAAQIAATGAPPAPAQAAELQALRTRLGRIARVTAWHLVGATLLMAFRRVVLGL